MNPAGIIFGVAEFLLTIGLAVATLRLTLWALDRATPDIDEPAEVRKGNVAVAIVYAAMLLASSLVVRRAVQPGIFAAKALVASLGPVQGGLQALGWITAYAMVALVLATVGLLAAMRLAERAFDFDPTSEVRGGNVAVAIVMAAVAIAIGLFLADGVEALIDAFPPPTAFVQVRTAGG